MKKYIGIMSGTSLDGVDVALVETDGRTISLLASIESEMPESIKSDVLSICLGQTTNLKQVGELDHRLGHLYADAVLQLLEANQIAASDVEAIGCHGQTVFHQPQGPYPFTMQLGDANIIAARTGIQVVADFRRKDMAFGGQGAPLVPAFHDALFSDTVTAKIIVNIGGIANVSVLLPQQSPFGYDTGPGNMLMDAWCMRHLNQPFDRQGQWAASGTVDQDLLATLLADPYLAQLPPKSTGREHYHLDWLDTQLAKHASIAAQDVQATLLWFTARSIADAVLQHRATALYVCGGGANNPLLMQALQQLLPDCDVATTSSKGVDSDFMEAMAFAWLAHQRLHYLPGNMAKVTGASQNCVLGCVYASH
ncbi:Anhydro-N-acetylmuramic acid kinase [Vibrio stylophorae]|uniref:Anhydro-N-acetylmuramic acid kinase n=1 Tax=Vibrio stylophorae TaxID=659351 RepID=A0ABM8ZU65_9VIBR|nr:anhydro-N-acetylmuramic acid kinase [Vibrio stylophorae]CAH0533485.1 Anhydro-N-acetylmuramic acid kinase [Vibrio stylophorae]